MTLQRKAIRYAVAARLRDVTAAEDRVFTNRSTPLFRGELPALLVYAESETVEFHNESPRTYLHKLRLAVEIAVVEEQNKRADDHLDDLSEQVVRLLEADRTVGGHCQDLRLTNYDGAVAEEGDRLIGGGRLRWEVEYLTDQGEADPAALSPLTGIGLDWDLPPPDGTLEAEDVLSLDPTP